MSLFKEAIESFQAGDLDFTGLDTALQTALQSGQSSGGELLQLLEQAYRAGHLPPQLYVILKSRIDAAGGGTAPVPGNAADATRAGAPVPEPEDDKTRIMTPGRTSAPAAAGGDRTVQDTGSQTQGDVTGGTGAAGDATVVSTTAPGVITSRTSTTGGTDSSWSNLQDLEGQAGDELKPGSVLKGRFVLEEIIGRGGMGEVYKARDLRKEEAQDRNPYVAVKILNESFKSHPESLKALQRESRKAQTLAHPNIVNVHDFDRDGTNVFMTMEFLEGEPLDHITKKNRGRGMPEKEALKITDDMGQALAHAHRHGIVHSDFKPGNAFLTTEGVTKVFDFGIARASSHASQAQGEATLFDAGELGAMTPAYASYEMLEGGEPDARDDIYALACVAYELLAGRHPFDKVPANQALEKGMVPERIKSLSRGQWKALARGLAFSREQRSASVMEFLSGLERKRIHKGLIVAAVAAAILAAVLLATIVPGYLHEQGLAMIVRELKSGDTGTVAGALETARQLEPDDRDSVLLEAKQEIIGWYKARQDELVNESLQLYDYAAAQLEIDAALELFPDSAQIHELGTQLENSRDQLLNDLNQRFNSHLQEGRLLASDQDDMEDVLRILAQVQADHPLLQDARLSAAYAEQATHMLEQGELDQSMNMLTAGLQRFPQDTSLVNLRDTVATEQARVERESRIASLTGQLTAALAALDSLEALDQVRPEMVELKRLDPDVAVVKKLQAKAGKLIDRDLAASIDNRRWDVGEIMLQNYVDVVDPGFLKSRQEKLVKARDRYLARMDSLYKALLDAVSKRRLSGKSKNTAQTLLGKLDREGADAALLERARAAIGQGYLELARDARSQGKWADALGYVEQGIQQQPGSSMNASLLAEREEIGRAEVAEQQQLAEAEIRAREAERQQQIDALHASFSQSLEQTAYQPETARESIKILDKLAAVNPSDPLLGSGRTQVASRLADEIRTLSNAQQWDRALAVSREAVDVIPGSEVLSSALVEIERGRTQQLAQKREQNINHYRQSLAGYLAKPVLDENWTTGVQDDLKILGELLTQDEAPWLEEQRAAIAALYLDKAREMRRNERFSEAKILLASARKFVPDDPVYTGEQQALADAEAKFMEANKEKLKLARIEGNKQTFLTQAKARDVKNAKKTLASLLDELPADDPFLVTTVPDALGNAYLRLAESAAKKGNYRSAAKLADAGLGVAPAMTALQEAKGRFQRESQIGDARKLMRTAGSLAAPKVRQSIERLKTEQKDDYGSLEQEFAGIVRKRIQTLSKQDYPAAETLLAEAKSLFPASSQLAALKLVKPEPPAAPARVPVPDTKPKQKPETKPQAPPATKVSKAKLGGVDCLPSLAGYGRRSRGTCYDLLPGDIKGPLLVVVPTGGGISEPFAISKYEIAVSDYNHYCKNSGKCSGVRAASGSLPVTGISLQQARAYAAWVSKQTGYTYRLPTDQEWSHAANAQGKQPGKDFNCRVMLGSQMIKGQALSNVNVGKPNGWGLKNYIGNAQEWVTTSSGMAVRGGAYEDRLSSCGLSLTKSHSGQADKLTGFRLVRTLKLGG